MTVEQAIARLNAIIEALDAEFKRAAEESALTAIGMIVRRIQKDGIPGRKYSKNKLPAFYFFDRWTDKNGPAKKLYDKHVKKAERKALRAIGEKVRKDKRYDEMEDGISYEEWRIANGLQVDHVDLTFTARMFNNLQLLKINRIGNTWVAVVGGKDEEVIKKLEWNTQRFGRFIKPTEDEIRLLQEQFKNRIEAFIKQLSA